MKLDSVKWPLFMPNPHDLAFLGPGTHLEIGMMESLLLDDQTVIASGIEGVGKAGKETFSVMENGRNLPVHDAIVSDHFPAENMADTLMTETDPQDRNLRSELLQYLIGNPRFFRSAWTRRDDDVGRFQFRHFLWRDLIVAEDLHRQLGIQLAKPLHQVVSERIVVVDEEEHA